MTKHRFYCPPDCFAGDHVVFPDDEARHAFKVLRLSIGDVVTVVDGAGGMFNVRMETVARGKAIGTIESRFESDAESPVQVTVGLALLKHAGRYETFLEKAVELGVHEIVPLQTDRTEKSKFRRQRAESILVAALKQSERAQLPALRDVTRLKQILEETDGCRLIAHEGTGPEDHIRHHLETTAGRVTLLIGPEGGFADREMAMATDAGWIPVWLGPRRLRAETAAMAAAGFIIMSLE